MSEHERCGSLHWQYRCRKMAGHFGAHEARGDDGTGYSWSPAGLVADGVVQARTFGLAEAEWLRLSDSERVLLMGLCCRHCGTTKLPCYCGPEWDE